MSGPARIPALVVKARGWSCAVALTDVVETMRPLPVSRVAGLPDFVAGVAVVRGAAVPVVDLGRLLGSGAEIPPTRFVTARAGGRTIALAVDEVRGIRQLEPGRLDALAAPVRASLIDAVGVTGGELLMVVRAGRILSDEIWGARA